MTDSGVTNSEKSASGATAPGFLVQFLNDFEHRNPFRRGERNDLALKLGRVSRSKGFSKKELEEVISLFIRRYAATDFTAEDIRQRITAGYQFIDSLPQKTEIPGEGSNRVHFPYDPAEPPDAGSEEEDLLEKNALDRPISLDIALFGRMVTSNAFADVEAAMQVAHAFSVNKVAMETDFFTAMDDCLGDSELGSGMMGDVDYNSSCYYLYASLDVDKLRENLKYAEKNDELIQAAIPVLLQAMVYTNPGGKQNSFAGHILPSAICIECKDYPVPVSYANAFVKPVYPTHDEDLISRSIAALANHIRKISEAYNVPVEKRFWFTLGQIMDLDIPNTENCKNFVELLNGVQDLLKP